MLYKKDDSAVRRNMHTNGDENGNTIDMRSTMIFNEVIRVSVFLFCTALLVFLNTASVSSPGNPGGPRSHI